MNRCYFCREPHKKKYHLSCWQDSKNADKRAFYPLEWWDPSFPMPKIDWRKEHPEWQPGEQGMAARQKKGLVAGSVYLVSAPQQGLVKIGQALNVGARLSSLKTGSPVPLELLATIPIRPPYTLEMDLHARFSHLRHHGEWFADSPEIRACFGLH